MILRGLMVACAVFVMDWVWARYTMMVEARRAHAAALFSMAIYLLGAFVTLQYVHDWRLIPFALIGAYFGTLVAITKK